MFLEDSLCETICDATCANECSVLWNRASYFTADSPYGHAYAVIVPKILSPCAKFDLKVRVGTRPFPTSPLVFVLLWRFCRKWLLPAEITWLKTQACKGLVCFSQRGVRLGAVACRVGHLTQHLLIEAQICRFQYKGFVFQSQSGSWLQRAPCFEKLAIFQPLYCPQHAPCSKHGETRLLWRWRVCFGVLWLLVYGGFDVSFVIILAILVAEVALLQNITKLREHVLWFRPVLWAMLSEWKSNEVSRWRFNGSPRLTHLTRDSSKQVVIFLMDDENTSNHEDLNSPRMEVTGVEADLSKTWYLPDLSQAFRPNRTDE